MDTSTDPTPLVSILVMTYNHDPYIEECLESLANQQTNFPFEILVGEDCSPDNTREKVIRMANLYPNRIKPLLAEKNRGVHANFAQLIEASKGKYIALCEGDDYWQGKDKLQNQIDVLESDQKIALVCTDADAFFQDTGRRIHSIHERNGQWNLPPEDMTLALLTRKVNIFTGSVCIPRELLIKARRDNPYEFSAEHPMADIQLWLELSRLGKIEPIRKALITYRVLRHSASHSPDTHKQLQFYISSLEIFEHYVKKFGYDDRVLHKVQMTQVWGMIELAARNKDDEDLRRKVSSIINSRNIEAITTSERIAFFAIQDKPTFKYLSPLIRIDTVIRKVKYRTLSFYKRIIRNRTAKSL